MPTISWRGSLLAISGGWYTYCPFATTTAGHLKSAGTPSSTRRLSGAVSRSRFGHKTRFRERHSASDCHQTHITVPANFKWLVTAQRLLIQSNVREVVTPGHWTARTIGAWWRPGFADGVLNQHLYNFFFYQKLWGNKFRLFQRIFEEDSGAIWRESWKKMTNLNLKGLLKKFQTTSKYHNKPTLRNAGEQSPPERTVGGGVLPPMLPERLAGGIHPSTAP